MKHTLHHLLRHIASWRVLPNHTFLHEIAVFCFGILLLAFWYQMTPAFTDIRYVLSQSEEVHEQSDNMFFSFDSIDSEMKVSFLVREGYSLRPQWFTVRADDCLGSLEINGRKIPEDVIGPCVIDTPKEMRLGPYLHAGINDVKAVVPDTGGRQGFSIRTAHADPLLLAIRIAITVIFTLLAFLLIRRRVSAPETRWLALLFVFGILLRLLYFDATPYDVRSNDADGHMDYIRYAAKHWTIPATGDGWEFYHPPLYYFITAPLYSIVQVLNLSYMSVTKILQFFSVLFSVGILGVCAWISTMLFHKRSFAERCLWLAILSIFPAMILLSPGINNDTLVQLLSFLAVALSLRFWQSGSKRSWVILLLIIALGMLTKMNTIVLVPVVFLTLFLHPDLHLRTKVLWALLGVLILLSLTEWIFVLRIVKDSATGIVGNLGSLNDNLRVGNHLSDYLTFNPWQILRHPFANPWEDSARRMFFFETLYRSSFFGELDLGSKLRFFSQSLLTLGLFLGLLSLVGMTKVREHYRMAFPVWLTFVFVLLGHLFFRFYSPYSSSENFRYSVVLLIPVLYFMLIALPAHGRVRAMLINILWCFVVFSTAFIITLCILNPT